MYHMMKLFVLSALVVFSGMLRAAPANLKTTFSNRITNPVAITLNVDATTAEWVSPGIFSAADLTHISTGAAIGFITVNNLSAGANFSPNLAFGNLAADDGWRGLFRYTARQGFSLSEATFTMTSYTSGGWINQPQNPRVLRGRLTVLDENGDELGTTTTGDFTVPGIPAGTGVGGAPLIIKLTAPIAIEAGQSFTLQFDCLKGTTGNRNADFGLISIIMNDSASIDTCTRTTGGNWNDTGAWTVNTVPGGDWVPHAVAIVDIPSGSTLTLTEPVDAASLTISGAGSLTSSDANQKLTTGKISVTSGVDVTMLIQAALAAPDGGEFTLHANGDGSEGGTTGSTRFEPIALNASALRITFGAVRTDLLTHGARLILDRGSLVNYGQTFDTNIYIGSDQYAYYRVHGGGTGTITGKIINEPGVTKPVVFAHTDGGTLILASDITGYTGIFANSAKAGALILNEHTIANAGNTIRLGGGTISYAIAADATATYPGLFTGTAPLTKNGAGTLILTGANTATAPLTIAGGTLEFSETGRWGNANITVNAGCTLKIGSAFNPVETLTVSGTIEGSITASNLILNAGATIRAIEGKVLAATETFTATSIINLHLPAMPAPGTKVTVLTLPPEVAADLSAFRLTGFANTSICRISQEGQDIVVRAPQGILITIY